jgi:ribonuclease P protein component
VFPADSRITTEEFDSILKKGKTFVSPFFSLCLFREGRTAFAVVASKKVSKKAVVRNKNKRRVRHALRSVLKNKIFSGSLVVFIRKDLSSSPYALILSEMETVLSKM